VISEEGLRDLHLGFKDLHLGFKDLHLGFKDLHLGFKDLHLGFKDLHLGVSLGPRWVPFFFVFPLLDWCFFFNLIDGG